MKGDLPGELIFRWFALRAMKTLSIFAFALFLPAVVNEATFPCLLRLQLNACSKRKLCAVYSHESLRSRRNYPRSGARDLADFDESGARAQI